MARTRDQARDFRDRDGGVLLSVAEFFPAVKRLRQMLCALCVGLAVTIAGLPGAWAGGDGFDPDDHSEDEGPAHFGFVASAHRKMWRTSLPIPRLAATTGRVFVSFVSIGTVIVCLGGWIDLRS